MQSRVSKFLNFFLSLPHLCEKYFQKIQLFMARTYIFNPDNDLALANGDANYLSPRSARRMALDLALLPVWYANEGDSVLIPNSETLYYWSRTSSNYSFPPEIKLITNIESIPSQPLSPWGWNPALVKQMKVRGLSDKYLHNIT